MPPRDRDRRYSVVIVTWNARDVLERCLNTVAEQRLDGELEVIVVDNASTDGTASLLSRHRSPLRVVHNDRNVGFSEASNQGAAVATGDVLFFLNPDTALR